MNLDAAYALVAPALRVLSGRGGGPKRVYVEGNVGSGKTTIVEELRRALHQRGKRACAFPEQIERWTHQRLLDDLYEDGSTSSKRAFETLGPLRDFVDRKRFLDAHASEYDYAIFERHPRTTLRVFGANEDEATRGLYESIHAGFPFMEPPEITIYLRASPESCLSRVRARGRAEERKLTLERLRELDVRQERDVAEREREGLVVHVVSDVETKSANDVVKNVLELI